LVLRFFRLVVQMQPHGRASSTWWTLKARVGTVFSCPRLDFRALALFRMGLGLVLFLNHVILFFDAEDLMSDDGVFPRTLAHQWNNDKTEILPDSDSFFFLTGSVIGTRLILGLGMIVSFLFATGAPPVSLWNLLALAANISQFKRIKPCGSGASGVVSMALFWALFLPLGEVWAIASPSWARGARLRGEQGAGESHHNPEAGDGIAQKEFQGLGSLCLVINIFLVYFTCGLGKVIKTPDEWLPGTSLQRALQISIWTRQPFASWIVMWPVPCRILTWLTLLLELIGIFLIFLPRARWVAVLLLSGFHIGTAILMNVGILPLAALVLISSLIPGWALQPIELTLCMAFGKLRTILRMSAQVPYAEQVDDCVRPSGPCLSRKVSAVICLPCIVLAVGHSFAAVHPRMAECVKSILPEPFYSLPYKMSVLSPLDQGWGMFTGHLTVSTWQVQIGVLENGHVFPLQIGQVYSWPPSPGFSPPNTSLKFLEPTENLSGGGYISGLWRDFFFHTQNNNKVHHQLGIFACNQYQRRKSLMHPGLHSVYQVKFWRKISLDVKFHYPLEGKLVQTHFCHDKHVTSDQDYYRTVISQLKELGVQIDKQPEVQPVIRSIARPITKPAMHAVIHSDGSSDGANRFVRRHPGHDHRALPKLTFQTSS